MFQKTTQALAYNGWAYLVQMSRLLQGRGKHERKLGVNYMRSHLRIATSYRAFFKDRYERGQRRSLLQAAFYEHGTDYVRVMNDLSRQKIILSRPMLVRLAQLEPMAFRSILELAGSDVPPPPQETTSRSLEKAYAGEEGYLDNDMLIDELQRGGEFGNPLAKMSKDELRNYWKKAIEIDEEVEDDS